MYGHEKITECNCKDIAVKKHNCKKDEATTSVYLHYCETCGKAQMWEEDDA